jgi:putative N6-adenine-specific DNA methylase
MRSSPLPAKCADDIHRKFKAIPWEDYLDVDISSVGTVVIMKSVTTPLIVTAKVKDAITDRFRELKGRRPDSGPGSMAWFFQAY